MFASTRGHHSHPHSSSTAPCSATPTGKCHSPRTAQNRARRRASARLPGCAASACLQAHTRRDSAATAVADSRVTRFSAARCTRTPSPTSWHNLHEHATSTVFAATPAFAGALYHAPVQSVCRGKGCSHVLLVERSRHARLHERGQRRQIRQRRDVFQRPACAHRRGAVRGGRREGERWGRERGKRTEQGRRPV
jgi:hypothetical protein